MSNQALQTRDPNQIRTLLSGDYFKKQVQLCLPQHLTPERFVRIAMTALMRTPKLADCTKESVTKCMLDLSALGIEPDGRRAHLIPFENRKMGTVECTLIIDWKGLAELALRSGTITKLHADIICENDDFAYDLGDILHHRIDWKQDRGTPYAAYAMAVTKDGMRLVQVLTKAEIEKIRDGSQGWKAFKAGYAKQSPWQDSPFEMWKKTAFRRLSKWLPLSPEIHDVMDRAEAPIKNAPLVTVETNPDSAIEINTAALMDPAPEPEPAQTGAEDPTAKQPGDDGDLAPQPAAERKPVVDPKSPEPPAPTKPAEKTFPKGKNATPQSELAKAILTAKKPDQSEAELTFTDFQAWATQIGILDCSSIASFDEIADADAKRILLANRNGSVVKGVLEAKGIV